MRKSILIKIIVALLIYMPAITHGGKVLFRDEKNFIIDFQQDTTVTDSNKIKGSFKSSPLFKINKLNQRSTIKQNEIEKLNYRSFGEIIENFPFTFEHNLGYLGQPNQINTFGFKTGNISFNVDGIPINRFWSNSVNVYDIQSEMIDSVIMVSPSQSFLYSNRNDYQSILIFTKDKISRKPFSRIRFYQASNDEGFVSVHLNTFLVSRLILTSEITNMAISPKNESFNNDFSNWQVTTKFRYLFSKSINVILGYTFFKNQTQLNGGAVNNTNLFNDLQATPVYPNRFQRNAVNQFSVNLLADIIDSNRTDATIYFQNMYDEFKQDKKNVDKKIPTILNVNHSKRIGMKIIQNIDFRNLNFEFGAGSEFIKINSPYGINNENINSWFGYSKVFANYSFFVPEVYLKILNENSRNYFGVGGSVKINLANSVAIKSGYSNYQKPFTWYERKFVGKDLKANINSFDFSVSTNSENYTMGLTYFNFNSDKYAIPLLKDYPDTSISNEVGNYYIKKFSSSGINISSSVNLWKFKLTTNLNYYFSLSEQNANSTPKYNGKFGLYFIDNMFENNLDLTGGINANFFSEKSFVNLDFEKGEIIYYHYDENGKISPINSDKIKSKIIFDLTFSGIIQKRANVFLIIENLLDTKYYLVNYYPMYTRGLRLGVNWKLYN